MKRTPVKQNNWDDDYYTKLAQKEGYPARSVYKLKEIQEKFSLIKKGDHVLDLGCAPGSWLLYVSDLVGLKGRVYGIDLKELEISPPGNAEVVVDDIYSFNEDKIRAFPYRFDVVVSDMAPNTIGNKNVDAVRSCVLCESALYMAQNLLKPGGNFVCKIFQGPDFDQFKKQVQDSFQSCRILKPKSTRKQSREIFIAGLKLKPPDPDQTGDHALP